MKLIHLCCVLTALAATAAAQPAITGVVNAGSRNSVIAQGAVFLIRGTSLGPDEVQQASFPLPTADGLAGVTVAVTSGDATMKAPLVYVSAAEIGAILPSSTPTGDATVTVTNNGEQATFAISVVTAAFGTFTQDGTPNGYALAFNAAADGTSVLNGLAQPAAPGQNVILNGTGLGAITGDETQSGNTEIPPGTVQVWVGTKPATTISAGRGTCCGGLDPAFPIPQGVAGWDVVQFTVPDGVEGCHVPVAVQTGDAVSNFATIAIAPADTACSDPAGLSASDLENLSGEAKVGSIDLSRSTVKISAEGMSMQQSSDSGSASFWRYDLARLQSGASPFTLTAIGSCTVVTFAGNPGDRMPVAAGSPLDAGDAITIKGPASSKTMAKGESGDYGANFGSSMSIPGISLPPGIPGLPGGGPGFLDAGAFTAANGSGGPDVGTFTASLNVPKPMSWENQDEIERVTRSEGVTVTWSGGDPDAFVVIAGSSSNQVGDVTSMAMFMCTERASAKQFAVPPVVTLSLPPSLSQDGAPMGTLSVGSTVTAKFTAPGIDIGRFSSSVTSMKNLAYE